MGDSSLALFVVAHVPGLLVQFVQFEESGQGEQTMKPGRVIEAEAERSGAA
ncbi:MAG TPA: hypothetical protein VKU44_08185 [Terriglobia bacterium]|nr:hypothetical protein [Terriglobia bacterium]